MPNGVVRTYSFDAADELRSLNYDLGATHIGDLAYTYDAAGRRISRSGSMATMPMPPSVASTAYDSANRLTTWGSKTQAFDNNGNLVTSRTITNTWNARNQLTASTAGSATFAYDALGRRVSKTVSSATTTTLYDGFNPLVMGGSTYLEGEGLDSVLASVNVSSGVVTSYATDALGSVVGVLNSSGSVAGSYGYDPYGNTAASGATSTLQYTGRENDGAYYYYRARYYDPATARFLSEDPLNIGGGANLYAYAGGNPLSNTDPTGLETIVLVPPREIWTYVAALTYPDSSGILTIISHGT